MFRRNSANIVDCYFFPIGYSPSLVTAKSITSHFIVREAIVVVRHFIRIKLSFYIATLLIHACFLLNESIQKQSTCIIYIVQQP